MALPVASLSVPRIDAPSWARDGFVLKANKIKMKNKDNSERYHNWCSAIVLLLGISKFSLSQLNLYCLLGCRCRDRIGTLEWVQQQRRGASFERNEAVTWIWPVFDSLYGFTIRSLDDAKTTAGVCSNVGGADVPTKDGQRLGATTTAA